MDEVRQRSKGWAVFSHLDLPKAYNLLWVDPAQRHLLAFTHGGRIYQFNKMPFGVATASEVLQRTVAAVLKDLGPSEVVVYADDILIGGSTERECFDRTLRVLAALAAHTIPVNLDKSTLGSANIAFLGWKLSLNRMEKDDKAAEAVAQMARPVTKSQLQSWYGSINRFREFVPKMGELLAEITDALSDQAPPTIRWTTSMNSAFVEMRQIVVRQIHLTTPSPAAALRITTDASLVGMGATLECLEPKQREWKLVSTWSRKLIPAERRYTTTKREALALVEGVEAFASWITGKTVEVKFDHQALDFILKSPENPMAYRYADRLLRFSCNFEYQKGSLMGLADLLSRLFDDANKEKSPQVGSLAKDEFPVPSADAWVKEIEETMFGWARQAEKDQQGRLKRNGRFIVPPSKVPAVLTFFHDHFGHGGQHACERLVAADLIWPKLRDDVAHWIASCEHCQVFFGNPPRMSGPVGAIAPRPSQSIWNVDEVQVTPDARVLLFTERFTRYVEASVIPDKSAASYLKALKEVFSRWPWPDKIVSDNGGMFTAKVVCDFLKSRNTMTATTSPYNPRANGMAERSNQTLLHKIRGLVSRSELELELPSILGVWRATPHAVTTVAPRDLMFAVESSDTFVKTTRRLEQNARTRNAEYAEKAVPFDVIEKGDRFLLFRSRLVSAPDKKVGRRWLGPFVATDVSPFQVQFALGGGEQRVSRHLVKRVISRRSCWPAQTIFAGSALQNPILGFGGGYDGAFRTTGSNQNAETERMVVGPDRDGSQRQNGPDGTVGVRQTRQMEEAGGKEGSGGMEVNGGMEGNGGVVGNSRRMEENSGMEGNGGTDEMGATEGVGGSETNSVQVDGTVSEPEAGAENTCPALLTGGMTSNQFDQTLRWPLQRLRDALVTDPSRKETFIRRLKEQALGASASMVAFISRLPQLNGQDLVDQVNDRLATMGAGNGGEDVVGRPRRRIPARESQPK